MATQDQERNAVILRRTFAATPERVFAAWTKPEEVKRWFGPEGFDSSLAEVDLRVGGAFRFHLVGPDGAVHVAAGEYREIEPPKRLVFTWGWETGANPFESRVTIELTPAGKGGTEFVMTHDLFPDEATRNSHESGWNGSLDKLQKILG